MQSPAVVKEFNVVEDAAHCLLPCLKALLVEPL
jgi:hypothetical protein